MPSNRARCESASLYHHPPPPPLINPRRSCSVRAPAAPQQLARLRDQDGAAPQCIGLQPQANGHGCESCVRPTDPSTAQSTRWPLTALSFPRHCPRAGTRHPQSPRREWRALTYRSLHLMYRTFGRTLDPPEMIGISSAAWSVKNGSGNNTSSSLARVRRTAVHALPAARGGVGVVAPCETPAIVKNPASPTALTTSSMSGNKLLLIVRGWTRGETLVHPEREKGLSHPHPATPPLVPGRSRPHAMPNAGSPHFEVAVALLTSMTKSPSLQTRSEPISRPSRKSRSYPASRPTSPNATPQIPQPLPNNGDHRPCFLTVAAMSSCSIFSSFGSVPLGYCFGWGGIGASGSG